MSSIYIKVTTEELISKADTVKSKVSAMQKEIDEAERLLNNTSSYWQGSAGDKKRKEFIKNKSRRMRS